MFPENLEQHIYINVFQQPRRKERRKEGGERKILEGIGLVSLKRHGGHDLQKIGSGNYKDRKVEMQE